MTTMAPALLDPVIGSFPCDDDIMHVALTQAGAADANEPRFLLQLRNCPGAAIAHTRTQAADELVHHLRQRAAVGHATLDPFRHQLCQTVAVGPAERKSSFGGGGGRLVHFLGVTLART